MNEENLTSREETLETRVPSTGPKKSGKGKMGIIILLIAIVALGALYFSGIFSSESETVPVVDESMTAAIVNGVTITRTDLDNRLAQVRSTIPQDSFDPTQDAGFEFQLLDEMINFELLLGAATEKSIVVTDEEVSSEVATLVEAFGGQEVLDEQLAATGISLDELRANMYNELLIQRLLDSETDIEDVAVSDEEIAAMYEEAAAGASEENPIPPLEQVEEILRSQLLQQKSAALIEAYIGVLRETADIQITL